jgi:hypothetical protein
MLQIPHSMEKRMDESKPRYWDLKEHACVCFVKSLSQGGWKVELKDIDRFAWKFSQLFVSVGIVAPRYLIFPSGSIPSPACLSGCAFPHSSLHIQLCTCGMCHYIIPLLILPLDAWSRPQLTLLYWYVSRCVFRSYFPVFFQIMIVPLPKFCLNFLSYQRESDNQNSADHQPL